MDVVGGGGGGGSMELQFGPVHGAFVVVAGVHGSPIATQVSPQSCCPGLLGFARLYAVSYVSINVGQFVVLPKLHM